MFSFHRPMMWAKAGKWEFWWLTNFNENSLWTLSIFKCFFLQITVFQTSWTQTPNIHITSLFIMLNSNIRWRNSKFDVLPKMSGNRPSSLCRTQNQASRTSWHSQKRWTLSWIIPQWTQSWLGTMLNLLNNLSLFGTILCTIMNKISLPLGSNIADCKFPQTLFQSMSILILCIVGGNWILNMAGKHNKHNLQLNLRYWLIWLFYIRKIYFQQAKIICVLEIGITIVCITFSRCGWTFIYLHKSRVNK